VEICGNGIPCVVVGNQCEKPHTLKLDHLRYHQKEGTRKEFIEISNKTGANFHQPLTLMNVDGLKLQSVTPLGKVRALHLDEEDGEEEDASGHGI